MILCSIFILRMLGGKEIFLGFWTITGHCLFYVNSFYLILRYALMRARKPELDKECQKTIKQFEEAIVSNDVKTLALFGFKSSKELTI